MNANDKFRAVVENSRRAVVRQKLAAVVHLMQRDDLSEDELERALDCAQRAAGVITAILRTRIETDVAAIRAAIADRTPERRRQIDGVIW